MHLNAQQPFADNGFAMLSGCVDGDLLSRVIEEAMGMPITGAGLRDPLGRSALFRDVEATALRPQATKLLGAPAFAVRSIFFDKTPEANWDVAWHQDVTIAVRERIDVEGFGPWSMKAGRPNVQPPARVLEKMVTLRLHLDACPLDNGPLLVVAGSHRRGIVEVRTLDAVVRDRDAIACVAAAGDVLAMRPLLLHASKKSKMPGHRRVLHIDYACEELSAGLSWAR